jgi:hypothetical protein
MLKHQFLVSALGALASLAAQSPLTTLYSGSALLNGPTVYFNDLVVNVPLQVTQIDVNSQSPAGTAGSLDIYWLVGSRVGNETNPGAWTFHANVPVVSAGANLPTVAVLPTPLGLPVGNVALAIQSNTISSYYTGTSGTSYSTAELTLLTGGGSANGALGTAICCQPRTWNGSIHYVVGGGGGTVATRSNYGTGCVSVADACFYENFATGTFDLSNTAMSLIHSGSGYLAIPGTTTFQVPSGGATTLALGDDTETTVTLSGPLKVGRTGSTNALTVCSNGFVSVAAGNGTTWTPVVATFLNAPQTGWWCWHDYNVTAAGSGQVKFEEVAGVAYVTWDGVYDFGGTTAANANTFQIQFELASGNVHFVWQTMSALGNGRLIGFSEGGTSADPGNTDISAVLPGTFNAATFAVLPLGLSAAARPIVGNTIGLVTANLGPTAPFGAILMSLTQFNPGQDLTGIGMAGCSRFQGSEVTLLYVSGGAPSVTTPFSVPNAIGVHVYAQSVAYDPASGLTLLGAIASNGVDLGIGNL